MSLMVRPTKIERASNGVRPVLELGRHSRQPHAGILYLCRLPETTVTSATDSTSETDTSTKSVDSAECPEGQHSHDEEACNPDETLSDTPTEAADTLGRS